MQARKQIKNTLVIIYFYLIGDVSANKIENKTA